MKAVVNCHLIDFPNAGREMVVKNEDDSYTVLINAKLSEQGRLNAYSHAMQHIESNDFEKYDVQGIEADGHEIRRG